MQATIDKPEIQLPEGVIDKFSDNKLNNTHSIKRLSIIIPAYNEEKTIATVLDRINEVKLIGNIEKEVIIVNDCSGDRTEQVINEYISNSKELTINYFKYIRHEINQGKGAAIHTGIGLATGEYLLVQDADQEYDPGEYNTLLKPIISGYADVVYGVPFYGWKCTPHPFFLAHHRQPVSHISIKHVQQPEPHRHGNRL